MNLTSQNNEKDNEPMENKEWKLIEKLLMSSQREQRRARRWGIAFKLLFFVYLFALLFLFSSSPFDGGKMVHTGPHTAVVKLQGLIAEDEVSSAANIISGLQAAFKDPNTQGVILAINSPGGTPVQAGYIYDEIKRLRSLHSDTPLYAVISDMGASGGYYVASAADQIYADKASLVGSIGVISSGFGFVDAMEKLGIERRLYTAGENKAFLDPFSPQKESEEAFWEDVLAVTHQQFIEQVKAGRGDRLVETPELFSGLIWSGEQALELGLIDGLGSASYVAREIIGQQEMVDFTPRRSPFEEFAEQFGVSAGTQLGRVLGLDGGLKLVAQ